MRPTDMAFAKSQSNLLVLVYLFKSENFSKKTAPKSFNPIQPPLIVFGESR